MKIKQWRIFLGLLGLVLVSAIFIVVVITPRQMTDGDYIHTLLVPGFFPPNVWERTEFDVDNFSRRKVELNRSDPTSLVYLDFLRWDAATPAPQSAQQAAERIDDVWIAGALASYSNTRRVRSCEFGDVRLYEYDAVFNRIAYNLRYWVIPLTTMRTATIIVAVSVDDRPYFDELSRILRPGQAGCE